MYFLGIIIDGCYHNGIGTSLLQITVIAVIQTKEGDILIATQHLLCLLIQSILLCLSDIIEIDLTKLGPCVEHDHNDKQDHNLNSKNDSSLLTTLGFLGHVLLLVWLLRFDHTTAICSASIRLIGHLYFLTISTRTKSLPLGTDYVPL